MKFGWREVLEGREEGFSAESSVVWFSEEVEGLVLRSRDQFGDVDVCCGEEDDGEEEVGAGGASLKMCTVSVAEETQRRVEAALKLML